jgi:hypothetical protein
MSNTIQIKRSSTAAAVPTAGQLAVGELAVNLTDRKLYTKNTSNAVVELGGAGVALTGDQTIAGVKTFSSSPVVPNATTSGQAVNKGQLDAVSGGVTSLNGQTGAITNTSMNVIGSWVGSSKRINEAVNNTAAGSTLTYAYWDGSSWNLPSLGLTGTWRFVGGVRHASADSVTALASIWVRVS